MRPSFIYVSPCVSPDPMCLTTSVKKMVQPPANLADWDMDGYMLMQQIKTLPPEQGGQVKAIALTAYAGDFNQQQALQAEFQRHLAKPIEPEQLVNAIVQTLAQSFT